MRAFLTLRLWTLWLALTVFNAVPVFANQSTTASASATASTTASSHATGSVFQDQFRDVASDLRCPTCVGLSVLESDAPFSKQIKDEVTSQLKAGKSHEEILTFFTERYGPWILRVPPKTGVSILAWAIPLAVLLAGPLAVWFLVWRRRDDLAGVEAVKPLEEILAEWNRDINKRRDILNSSLPGNEGTTTLATDEGGNQV